MVNVMPPPPLKFQMMVDVVHQKVIVQVVIVVVDLDGVEPPLDIVPSVKVVNPNLVNVPMMSIL